MSYRNCCSFILHHPELDPLILSLVLIIFFVLIGLFFTTLMSHRRSVKLECITYYIFTTNIVLPPSESQSFAKKIEFYIFQYRILCRYLVKKIWPKIPTPDSKFHGLFTIYGGEFQVRIPTITTLYYLLVLVLIVL